MANEINNNASASTKGIVYQFYVALENCFELEEGESVYIEYYGDVTISGKTQIEVKNYKKSLTNLDHNFWNTVNNWMNESFSHEKYKSLILHTTQSVSHLSTFKDWNEKDSKTRLIDLLLIHSNYSKRKSKNQKTLKLMNTVLDAKNRPKLIGLLPKISIQHSQIQSQLLHKRIRDRYTKGIPKSSQDKFIRTLLGFIISPQITTDIKWEISFDDFSIEVKELTKVLKEDSIIFPKKIALEKIDNVKYTNSVFVKKISEINYHEVIPDAISDYVHTNSLILKEMKASAKYESLKSYKQEINEDHKIKFRQAKRKVRNEDCINGSQDFYDDFTGKEANTFHGYNSVDSYFRRGLIQGMADDDTNYNIKWLLNDE